MPYDRCRRVLLIAAAAAIPALMLTPPARADGDPVSLPPLRLRVSAEDSCAGASDRKAERRPWTHQALQLSRSWELSRGVGVTVAVIDTGVSAKAPALSGRVDTVGAAGEDCVGHGSFAAGLIAGGGEGAVTGVAPAADILAVRGTDVRGRASASLVAEGIETAVDEGADVVYVGQALAGGGKELMDAVARAGEEDVLVVAPAVPDVAPEGADGRPDTRARAYWPARIPDVVSVVDHGPDGGRPKSAPEALVPDLSAPGDAVVGIGPEGSGHFIGSGSSLAAAHVAGAAALIRSYQPGLSAADVARRLTQGAYPDHTPRLDVYSGLSAVLPTGGPAVEPEPAPARVPMAASAGTTSRALWIGGGSLAVVLVVSAAMAVVPRGKARRWRPAE
ncbi:S8 family serine peptidase [Streptomyces coelicoflavus]|uniref:S8 family serine peptidase n=1 Tax=Streptomyces coelicoflavus TaxID=285562 RepID=UPI003823E3DB